MNYLEKSFSKLADLESFDPKAFVPDDKASKEVCGFVLTLALVYTDIKNVSILLGSVLQCKPTGEFKVQKEWGEFNGLVNFLNRLNISILHELFKFINANKTVLDDKFFKEVIKSIGKDTLDSWNALVDTSLDQVSSNKLAKELMLIRNKISFHYDRKIILKGYDHLYNFRNLIDRGYISRGTNMEETRFYFADGAAESYIHSLCEFDDIESLFAPIRDNLQKLNLSIWFIVINFIQKRGFAFRAVTK